MSYNHEGFAATIQLDQSTKKVIDVSKRAFHTYQLTQEYPVK